ncbi:MAG: 30S ribosomal protein S12 methylthiotransferase RimO [Clostridiales bacterium]|nr:30S ribosomal protein S12 methylthiotransferase RimO [Clostridiales bacterium]
MKILYISLGCDKNLVDSEVMLALIKNRGFELTDDEYEAELIIINTCTFINDAKEESINTILEMAQYKEIGKLKGLIVTGCLAQRYKDEIFEEMPEVDAIVGTSSYDQINSVIDEVLEGNKSIKMEDLKKLSDTSIGRVNTTGGYYSYLKIAEGCDKHCTYCIIPKVRGNYRSVEIEKLIKEAKDLVSNGVRELVLVAQETTLYGVDIYGEKSLPKLLKELCKIEGLEWIRILYAYPEEITDELIQVMKEEDKICNYIDMPIQHASDNILRKMGRRTNKQELIDIINKLRTNIPDIAIRTTLISGFPGETETDHEELLNFVEEMKFDRLGVFTYSKEEDTPAAIMQDQIDEELKEQRRDEIMLLQQDIAFEHGEAMIGRKLRVIIEGKLPDDEALDYSGDEVKSIYIARTYKDAPGVDGYIFVPSSSELMSGDFIDVEVTGAQDYDLIGSIIEKEDNR